ncbi:MAG: hypothetical protein P8Z74_20405, partial [Acidobacteriota bacterium]
MRRLHAARPLGLVLLDYVQLTNTHAVFRDRFRIIN